MHEKFVIYFLSEVQINVWHGMYEMSRASIRKGVVNLGPLKKPVGSTTIANRAAIGHEHYPYGIINSKEEAILLITIATK